MKKGLIQRFYSGFLFENYLIAPVISGVEAVFLLGV